MGILVKSVDISIGEVTVNLNEGLLVKKKSSLESCEKNIGIKCGFYEHKRASQEVGKTYRLYF